MRKTQSLTITAEGRDKGKTFILTEMPADQGERWANRAFFALTNTGAAVPEEALTAGGWAALAAVGIQALGMLSHEKVQPLLDELWPACVRYHHATNVPLQEIQTGPNSQIEEIGTRYRIYAEIWKLHTGFSLPVVPPTSGLQSTAGEEGAAPGWLSSMSRALLGLWSRIR